MSVANAGVRRALRLDASLKQIWEKKCALLRDTPEEDIPEKLRGFKPKLCHSLGVCVCNENRQLMWCHENLRALFKHVFWKKRKSSERSEARKLLEDGLLFVEMRSPDMQPAQALRNVAENSDHDSWDSMLEQEREQIDTQQQQQCQFFFYVGQFNFSTWHFACLQMEKVEQPLEFNANSCDADEVCYLQLAEDPMQGGLFTNMQIFSEVLDLQKAWSMRFYGFSGLSKHWPEQGTEIPAKLLTNVAEFMFWKGPLEERTRRKPSDAGDDGRKTRKRGQAPRKNQSGGRQTKRFRSRKSNRAIEDAQAELDSGSEANADVVDEASDMDDDVSGSDSSESSADASSHQTAVSEPEVDSEHNAGNDDARNTDASENSAEEFLDELFEEDARLGPIAADEDLLAAEEPPLPPPEEPPPPQEPPPPAGPAPARPRDQRAGVVRGGLESRDVFVLPNALGTLRYYHGTKSMQAFCPWGREYDVHESDCRKSATCNPQRRGSGRPIGLLVAWLQAHKDFATKHEHVHTCKPSLQQRRDARAFFMQLPEAAEFARFEKPKANPNDDDDEPPRV